MARLIGLLGGTFDPVHVGHLQSARTVRRQLALDELRLLPCRQPTHRHAPVADADHRLAMIRLALDAFPELTLDTGELERAGPSYAVDTLAELYRCRPDAVWCWLMGVDAFQRFNRWHRWARILELAHLVVMTRPGYALDGEALELQQRLGIAGDRHELLQRRAGGIVLLDVNSPDVSSSHIRRQLLGGRPVDDLVPPAVADYLEQHSIYSKQSVPS